MTEFEDSLALIAASYRVIAENLVALRRQYALLLIGFGLVFLLCAGIFWHLTELHQAHTVQIQTLTVQTEALRQLLRPH